MKISIDIRVIKDQTGKRGLRVWPEIEATTKGRNWLAIVIVTALAAASLYAISVTPDPELKPSYTIGKGY